MKIYRPDNLAVLYRSYQFAQRDTLAIGMMGLFHFDRSALVDLRPEPELWATVAQVLGDNAILDEGFAKPVAEYKIYGAAYGANGAAVTETMVGVQIGSLSKQLVVTGERHFNMAGLISVVEPFTRMPLTPQNAFGGPGYPGNLRGKGHAKSVQDETTIWPLPNVETPSHRIGNRGDVADPAGFWSFDAAAPQRRRYLGQCDERWIMRTWPHLPSDTRPEYFLTAPQDQRFSSYLRGGEAVQLLNLHPQRADIRTQLPNLRARCFVNRRLANKFEEFSEITAQGETVWLFPELECGIVLYRGQAVTADADASDILHALVEWESLDNAPLPFEHYRNLLRQKLAEEAGLVVTAPAAPAPAPVAAEAAVPAMPAAVTVAAVAVTPVSVPPEAFLQVQAMAAKLEQETRAIMEKNGLTDADVMCFLKPEVEQPAMSFAEVEKMALDLDRQSREIMAKNNLTDADVQHFLKPEVAETPVSLKDVKGMLQDLDRQTHDILKKNGMTEKDIEAVFTSRPELSESWQNLQAVNAGKSSAAEIAALPEAFPTLSLPTAAVASAAPPAVVATPARTLRDIPVTQTIAVATQQLTREQVIARHAVKQSLRGYDLSGVDLSGLNLAEADFSGSLMTNTNFVDSKLQGVNFSRALLQQADFSGSDLSHALLQNVSADGGKFARAKLPDAQLQNADFSAADFSEAQLGGADLSGGVFDRAAMGKVQASGCRANRASFAEADLSGADFSRASLREARFNGGKLDGGNFAEAQCDNAEFYGAQATQAKFDAASLQASRANAGSTFSQAGFAGARLSRANWVGAVLHDAMLDKATLDDADFSNVKADRASFRGVSGKRAQLAGANLSSADLTAVNLFKGSLRKTVVRGALLRNANLYGVDFEGTQPTVAMLEGANIDQTILRFRAPLI